MMCKDCIHVEVCREYVTGLAIQDWRLPEELN